MALRPIGPILEFVVNLILAAAMLTAVTRVRLSPRRLITPTLVIAIGIQLLNTIGRNLIARSENRPAYTVVATSVGLLIYLYLLNQLILFGAALAATATKGTAFDLGAGAAGLGSGGVLRPQLAAVAGPAQGNTIERPDRGRGCG